MWPLATRWGQQPLPEHTILLGDAKYCAASGKIELKYFSVEVSIRPKLRLHLFPVKYPPVLLLTVAGLVEPLIFAYTLAYKIQSSVLSAAGIGSGRVWKEHHCKGSTEGSSGAALLVLDHLLHPAVPSPKVPDPRGPRKGGRVAALAHVFFVESSEFGSHEALLHDFLGLFHASKIGVFGL